MTVRVVLAVRLSFGLRVRVKWRIVVAVRAMMVRRETVRSCALSALRVIRGKGGETRTRRKVHGM